MASRAERIVDHFTDDSELEAIILRQVDEVRAGTKTLDHVIAEHTDDPAIVAQIKEIAAKVRAGHGIHAISGYHHVDPAKAQSTSENVLKHHGVVADIMNS